MSNFPKIFKQNFVAAIISLSTFMGTFSLLQFFFKNVLSGVFPFTYILVTPFTLLPLVFYCIGLKLSFDELYKNERRLEGNPFPLPRNLKEKLYNFSFVHPFLSNSLRHFYDKRGFSKSRLSPPFFNRNRFVCKMGISIHKSFF